jgi:hypothetical protein
MTADNFCLYLQTSKTGGQWYSDTSPFSIPCGLYYKPMTIINDYSRVINKLETSHTDDAGRVIIYDPDMFIVQAIGFIALGRGPIL